MTPKLDKQSHFPFDSKDTQNDLIRMTEKKDTDPISTKHQLPVTGVNESIIILQIVALTSLDTSEEQLEKWSISSDQGGFNPHLAKVLIVQSLHYHTDTVLSGVPDCLPSGNPIQASNLQGVIFINQITDDKYI